jgi:hypothetical protein
VNEFRKAGNKTSASTSPVSTSAGRITEESLPEQSFSVPKASEVPSGQNFVWVNPVFEEPKNDSTNPDDKRNL